MRNLALMWVWAGCLLGCGGRDNTPSNTLPPVISDDGFDMVLVECGTFTMGCTAEQGDECEDDEKPAREVSVRSFYIGKYPVTQGLWTSVMGSDPSSASFKFGKGDDCPVYNISWDTVQVFIQKLNEATGKTYRLPREAEWEYAARGGKKNNGYKYSGGNNIDDVALYSENSDRKIHPVGTKQANELDIYDMSGNVWEFTNTRIKTKSGSSRVFRGGNSGSGAEACRVSRRGYNTINTFYGGVGFRLALPTEPEEEAVMQDTVPAPYCSCRNPCSDEDMSNRDMLAELLNAEARHRHRIQTESVLDTLIKYLRIEYEADVDYFMNNGTVTGNRSKESVAEVFAQNRSAITTDIDISFIYGVRLCESPGLADTATVTFAIDESGKVISAKSTMDDRELDSMIVVNVKRWDFEKIDSNGDTTVVTFPSKIVPWSYK